MHESSLAKNILEVVLDQAKSVGGQKVQRVRGWIAEDESLSPESLSFHFLAHAKGTLAEDAKLDFRLIWVSAQCSQCHNEYKPDHHMTLCPECGSTEGKLLGPKGMEIESIEIDDV